MTRRDRCGPAHGADVGALVRIAKGEGMGALVGLAVGGGGERFARSNRAVTVLSELIMRVQGTTPEQSPCHPANTNPRLAVAVRMTVVRSAKLALHVCPHPIPDGLLLTLPSSLLVTVTRCVSVEVSNAALTDRSALMVRLQGPFPEQSPCHPTK